MVYQDRSGEILGARGAHSEAGVGMQRGERAHSPRISASKMHRSAVDRTSPGAPGPFTGSPLSADGASLPWWRWNPTDSHHSSSNGAGILAAAPMERVVVPHDHALHTWKRRPPQERALVNARLVVHRGKLTVVGLCRETVAECWGYDVETIRARSRSLREARYSFCNGSILSRERERSPRSHL